MARRYKVQDTRTGKIVEVDESQLGQYGLKTPTSTPAATVPPPQMQQATPQAPDLATSIGSFLLNNLFGATKKYATNTINDVQAAQKDPKKAQQLLDKATATAKGAGIQGIIGDLITGKGFAREAVKPAAELASFAVPFGKGGNVLSKILLPGAAVGGLSGISQEDATPQSVAGNAILGAGGAGVIQGGSKVLNGILKLGGKLSPALEKGAQTLEQGTREIRIKPSIYGAAQEKAINETLTRYGVKGSPQVQYEMLQPTMGKIESKIQKVIDENPTIAVTKEEIKRSFMDNLKSSLRSKDLTQTQATTEIDGYLKDLVKASGGTGKFVDISLERLRNLKKLVNEDYGPVHDVMTRGGALTPRQKVIAAAWDSLDNAVKNASPEMKALLRDESNLYKSAPSLSAARSNPPTLRMMGTSIPKGIEEKAKGTLVDMLRETANKTNGVSNASSKIERSMTNPLLQTLIGQFGARGATQINQPANQSQEQYPPVENTSYNNEQSYNVNGQSNQIIPPADSISQNVNNEPQRQITAQQMQQVLMAQSQGLISSKTASAIKDAYDVQEAAIKTTGTGSVPAVTKQRQDLSRAGLRAQKDALDIFTSDPNIVAKGLVTAGLLSRKYDSAISRAVEGLLRARSGAAVPDSEVKKYIKDYGPQIGDPMDVALYKLEQLRLDLQDALNNNANVVPDTITQP